MPLDRGAQRLLRMLVANGQGAVTARSPIERRRALEALAEMVEETPAEPVGTRDLTLPGPGGPLGARLYTPTSPIRGGIVYFHGGGWVAGGLATHDGACRRLAIASRLRLMAIDYRLAPEHPFPAAIDDAIAAVRWAANEAEALGFAPARLVVAGDSAGGALAAAVAQSSAAPPLALQVLICPILNLADQSVSRRAFAEGYFLDAATLAADIEDYRGGGGDLGDPRLSPLLADHLGGLPPTLIHTAEFDPFRDEGEAYATRLAGAGVTVRHTRHDGMIHYFYAMPRAIPHADKALSAIGFEIGAALSEGDIPGSVEIAGEYR